MSRNSSFADRMALAVADVLGASRASLMLLESDSGPLRVAGATGCDVEPAEMDPVEIGSGVAGWVLDEGRALVVSDVGEHERFADRIVDGRYRSGAFAVAPVKSDGKPIGVLCATERGDGESFGSQDLSLLQILALQIGPLIARLRTRGATEAAADVDRSESEPQIAADPAPADTSDSEDAELARAICDVLTAEVEPDRVISASLAVVSSRVPAAPVSLYLLESNGRELILESQCERAGHADRERLPTDSGLTGVVVQTGRLVATDAPDRDPRFDPEVDTPECGEAQPPALRSRSLPQQDDGRDACVPGSRSSGLRANRRNPRGGDLGGGPQRNHVPRPARLRGRGRKKLAATIELGRRSASPEWDRATPLKLWPEANAQLGARRRGRPCGAIRIFPLERL